MKKWWMQTGVALLLLSTALRAQEVSRPWEEYGKLIGAKETIASHGPTLFGDAVDLQTGALSFSTTDVSIPGNSKLSVAFSRSFKVSNRKGYINDSTLADWELDMPHLSGVFTRCSASTLAQARPPQINRNGTVFNPEDYWQGNQANMPGGGEMLYNTGSASSPTSGGPYYWMTAAFTYFSCLPTIKNGSGEGFLAIAADGTKYWFDWKAQYVEPTLKGGLSGSDTLERRRTALYATRIEDRFGNWVTYTYVNVSGAPAKLTSIQANDGRKITIGYNAHNHVSSVSTGAQTWTYQYSYPTPTTGTLTAVVQPDASQWTIAFSALSSAKIRYDQGQPGADDPLRSCGDPGQVVTGGAQGTITHPSGATGTFLVEPKRHGRSNVPKMCANYTSPYNDDNDDVAYYPLAYDAFSLISKTVSGPGLAAMQWTYGYSASIFFAPGTGPTCGGSNCGAVVCTSDACAGTATTVVNAPGGQWSRYTYGNSYRYNEGKLLKVERGSGPTTIGQTQTTTYNLATSGQPFPTPIATSPQPRGDGFTSEYLRPETRNTIVQDGVTYSSAVNLFDGFARPTSVTRASTINGGYTRTDTTEYHDDLSKWVLGQIKRSDTNGLKTGETEFTANAQPYRSYRYGETTPSQTLTYNADGTVATVKDGNNNVTTLSNWKRGIPQTIQHPATAESPSGSTQSASVNDSGWIDWVTDENGYKTSYQYDTMGRLSRIVYPTDDTVAWNDKLFSFQQVNQEEMGVPAGHWRQMVVQGNYEKLTLFDALWRPILQYERDTADSNGTYRLVRNAFDHDGRQTFASYPRNSYADGSWNLNTGTWTNYDALGRVTKVEQDSELGKLTTTTAYATGGDIVVTNPRGHQTRTRYAAWDQPTTDYPIEIIQPAGATTTIDRDLAYFLRPKSVLRSGSYAGQPVQALRKYYYDGVNRLCRTDEPETGSTVMGYDANDNLSWSAAGLSGLNSVDCDHVAAYNAGRTVTRNYDARNRITQLGFPDGLGNQSWTYTKDSLPATITTYNGSNTTWPWINAYHYNKRRLLDGQGDSISQPGWYTWSLGYGYDRNGNLSVQTYPTGLMVGYAPNALGQATQVATVAGSTTTGTYASGVSYYPNGAIKQFTYGNGLVHSMWQNARQLPWTVDSSWLSSLSYTYDENGNPVKIEDNTRGADFHRYLEYDAQDRLLRAGSLMFGGTNHWIDYAYDPIDNLRSVTHPGVREHSYWYDTNNRLTNVRNAGGATVTGLGYDVQGNLNNKNGQNYWFSYGNRLREVTGKESYAYDGLGRRVQTMQADGTVRLFQYSQAGQYLFGSKQTTAGVQTTQENIYLAGSLIATVDHNWPSNTVIATTYHHTDALGSPVATTNSAGALIERTNYEPYGSAINKTVDGIGYTGHVMDGATGLTYMQQRYYDPTLGRFLSVDPVAANSITGENFNRYWYASNNPFRFADPDGRKPKDRGASYASDGLIGTTSGTVKDSTAVTPQKITAAMVKSVGPKEATQAQIKSVVNDVNAVGATAQRAGDSRAVRAFNKLIGISIDSSDWSAGTYDGTQLPYSALAYASFDSKSDRGSIVLNASRFFGSSSDHYRTTRLMHEVLHFDTAFDNQKVRELNAGCRGWNCKFEHDVDAAARSVMSRGWGK